MATRKRTPKQKLEDVLDIANEELEEGGREPISTITIISPSDVRNAMIEKPTEPALTNEQEDFNVARKNLQGLIVKSTQALDGILGMCAEGGEPRTYEVAGQLLKVSAEITKDLLSLHKLQAELNKFKLPPASNPNESKDLPTSITDGSGTKIVFAGTNLDLLKAIKSAETEEKSDK